MDLLTSPTRRLPVPCALRRAARLLCALAASLPFSGVAAPQYRSSADEVKAVSLFNVTKFVEWPESAFDDAQAPIMFGILGGDPGLGFHLQRLATGEKVQGRSIVIRNQRFGDDLRRCHILFIGAAERQHIPQILAGLQAASVLTVSDVDGFADAGGVMQLVMDTDRARFIVNLDAATQGQLRVSAKLLALARVIHHPEAAR